MSNVNSKHTRQKNLIANKLFNRFDNLVWHTSHTITGLQGIRAVLVAAHGFRPRCYCCCSLFCDPRNLHKWVSLAAELFLLLLLLLSAWPLCSCCNNSSAPRNDTFLPLFPLLRLSLPPLV